MMKKLLVFLLCVFWSFFAYSMDYKEFLANNEDLAKSFSIDEYVRILPAGPSRVIESGSGS